jgi:uncharacterized protein (TIGR03067 family)
MKRLGVIPTVILVSLLAGADAPKSEAVKRELARFRGTWVLTSFEAQGQERAQDEIKKEKLVYVFDGDKLTQKLGDKLLGRATIRIDPTQSPKTLEVTGTPEGETKEGTIQNIYKIDSDTLTLAYTPMGFPRATKFVAEGLTMIVKLKRVKP